MGIREVTYDMQSLAIFLPFHLLPRTVEIHIQTYIKKIIFLPALHNCETQYLTLREWHKF